MDNRENTADLPLAGRRVLITGAARRIGRHLALAAARAGADVIVHHGHSPDEAGEVAAEIRGMGREAQVIQADLNDPQQALGLMQAACKAGPVDALINNASIFEPMRFMDSTLEAWQRHMDTNLTAPFLLIQAFARNLPDERSGKIVNVLDWRALRPGYDHFPYTISKAGLAALTKSTALALAPRITVNGLALGAILPPSDGQADERIIKQVPMQRWAQLDEVSQAVLFLLTGPDYITGEIIHLDGGRHLV